MSEEILIRIFKVDDFENWIFKNVQNGLGTSMISRNRAIAQINNPSVEKEDILLTAAYINAKCIGYRGVFPEKVHFGREYLKIGWLSTFYVDPNYRGRGIASKLMEPVINYYTSGIGSLDSAKNAIRVYKKLNWNVTYFERVTLYLKTPPSNYNQNSYNVIVKQYFKTLLRPVVDPVMHILQILWSKYTSSNSFSLKYIELVDDVLMQFIRENSKSNCFNITQDKLNWILKYKWGIEAPCISRTDDNYHFKNYIRSFNQYGLVVYKNSEIQGFYILRQNNGQLSIPYIFYDSKYSRNVFNSILEHAIALKSQAIHTTNESIIEFIRKTKFPIISKYYHKVSFSHTNHRYLENIHCNLQDGDGDLFF